MTSSKFAADDPAGGKYGKLKCPAYLSKIAHSETGHCGFQNRPLGVKPGQHHLGHKNIQHTVRYTEMAPERFKDFWRD
jgi:hypothetical protein